MSFGKNLVCFLSAFKYINLNINFKLKKVKKDYSMYLGINLREVKDAL